MFNKPSKPQNRIDSLIGATTRIEGNVVAERAAQALPHPDRLGGLAHAAVFHSRELHVVGVVEARGVAPGLERAVATT